MRFLTDENFNNDILRALRRRHPDMDILRVQDTEIYQADDPVVLELASREVRILLTHDIKTMLGHAYERIGAGLPLPGVIAIPSNAHVGQTVDDLSAIFIAGTPADFENQVRYLPLR